jgi:hypothetical protein
MQIKSIDIRYNAMNGWDSWSLNVYLLPWFVFSTMFF